MKRIGIVVNRIDRGAAELLEVHLAQELVKLGYYVCIIPLYSVDRFQDREIEENLLRYVSAISRVEYDLKSKPLRLFSNLLHIRKMHLDIIISHNRGTDFVTFLLALGTKTKKIKAFHEYYEPIDLSSPKDYVWSWIIQSFDYSYHITQHSLVTNRETFQLDKDKSSVVLNVLEKREERRESFPLQSRFQLPKGARVILTVARIVPNKGIELNIDIVAPLLKEDPNLYYLIAGDTELNPNYYAMLIEKLKEYQIEKQVQFIGFQKSITSLMREVNLLLHFARHEAFGLVLIEAINTSLPIVGSAVGGMPDLLKYSSFRLFGLNQLNEAREEVRAYLYFNKKENAVFRSGFEDRTHADRAQEISVIFDKLYC